jgi:hypothetical protein
LTWSLPPECKIFAGVHPEAMAVAIWKVTFGASILRAIRASSVGISSANVIKPQLIGQQFTESLLTQRITVLTIFCL